MPALQAYRDRPVVLLTNDDGPPCDSSPNIFGFCKLLQEKLGWDVKVVIPDCQKSWVGKAYAISDVITARYFYPLEPDGYHGEISDHPRPLRQEQGETMEWVLLAGTPASCTNIGLHNLYPGEIDMVISGPNHGRNSSTAFALSSGTLGAALAGALAIPIPGPSSGPSLHTDHIPCIAVSYGVVTRPSPPRANDLAHEAAVDVCRRLWDDWGYEDTARNRPVQVYTVNVPLLEDKLEKTNRRVVWTNMWRNAYGSLFKATEAKQASYDPGDHASQSGTHKSSGTGIGSPAHTSPTAAAGPGAVPPSDSSSLSTPGLEPTQSARQPLRFKFAPTMGPLLFPILESLPEGTDAWAFAKGYISVTPIRVEYAGPVDSGYAFGSGLGQQGPGAFWDEL